MSWLERFSQLATRWSGTSAAFFIAVMTIVVWAAFGPFCTPPYSDTWQLIINTLTTLVTFLMVFLIQRAQNKDSLVIHTKLNELIAASRASNRLIDLEDLSEEDVRELHKRFQELAKKSATSKDPTVRTSIEKEENCEVLDRQKAERNGA
jgi:low affinity Fe/Cu permease